MDKFEISGPTVLKGKIGVDGSKNAALPIIAGTLLLEKGETVLRNIPPLRDVYTLIEVLEHIGARVKFDASSQVMTVNAETINHSTAPYELMRKMRGSFLVLGPLLARTGEATISLPGGCSLGARPVDYHIKAFGYLGAKISEKGGYVVAKANPLVGAPIYFDKPSHTGTENLLFGACFAKGKTRMINAACDPEVVAVADFLNKAGARIHGAGTPDITVEPVRRLEAVDYTVPGDRLVAGTYMIAAAMTQGQLEITDFNPEDLTVVIHKLTEMGCKIQTKEKSLTIKGPKRLGPVKITTFPYPGFPTDLQASLMAAACLSSGTSYIQETVYVDRFAHTMELRRLGADIAVSSSEAIIHGSEELQGAEVMAPDIRAGAGITLACLAARGKSGVLRIYHIDRAYHRLEEKLSSLGADIKRVAD